MAGDDTLTVDEDTVGTVDVLVNDRDPEGGALTITDVSTPAHGTATFAIGTVGYRPAPNYHGPDSFTYTVTDPQGNTATATVNVTVRPVNDLPQANDDTVNVQVGVPATIHVLANDTGLGDGVSALSIVVQPQKGSATVGSDGQSIVYTATKKGPDTLRYRVYDSNGDNSEAVIHITVGGPDIAPKAVNISVPCAVNFCQTDLANAPGINTRRQRHDLPGRSGRGRDQQRDQRRRNLHPHQQHRLVRPGQRRDDGDGPVPDRRRQQQHGAASDGAGEPDLPAAAEPDGPERRRPGRWPANTPAHFQLVGTAPDNDPLTYTIDSVTVHRRTRSDSAQLFHIPTTTARSTSTAARPGRGS